MYDDNQIVVHDSFQYSKCPFDLTLDKIVIDGALRLFNYMLVKASIPNWKFNRATTMKDLCISHTTYAKCIKNLEENFWIESRQNQIYKDSKGKVRRSTTYHLYLNKNDHPALQNSNHNKHRYRHFNELVEKASVDPTELYKHCKYLIDGYEFNIPLNSLDLTKPANVLARIRVDENSQFEDEAGKIKFNLESATLVWDYLWQYRLDEVLEYIKQKRR